MISHLAPSWESFIGLKENPFLVQKLWWPFFWARRDTRVSTRSLMTYERSVRTECLMLTNLGMTMLSVVSKQDLQSFIDWKNLSLDYKSLLSVIAAERSQVKKTSSTHAILDRIESSLNLNEKLRPTPTKLLDLLLSDEGCLAGGKSLFLDLIQGQSPLSKSPIGKDDATIETYHRNISTFASQSIESSVYRPNNRKSFFKVSTNITLTPSKSGLDHSLNF